MQNLTKGTLKVSSLDFMKIQSDYNLLFLFPRYSRLKSWPVGPETYPAQDRGLNISITRCFPDMQCSPKCREGVDLTSHEKLEISNDKFLSFRKSVLVGSLGIKSYNKTHIIRKN